MIAIGATETVMAGIGTAMTGGYRSHRRYRDRYYRYYDYGRYDYDPYYWG